MESEKETETQANLEDFKEQLEKNIARRTRIAIIVFSITMVILILYVRYSKEIENWF